MMLALLAACGGTTEPTPEPTVVPRPTVAPPTQAPIVDVPRVNPYPEEDWGWLDVTWQGINQANVNPLTQFFIDKFKLNITGMTGDMMLLAAANNLPDIFGGQDNMAWLGTVDPASSMLRPIPESAFEWYPYALDMLMGSDNIRRQYDSTGYWWGIPRYRDDDTRTNYIRASWMIRMDYAVAVGYSPSWRPQTMEDLARLWQDIADGDPAGNGRQVYGISGGIWSPHFAPWVNFRHWVEEDGRWILGELSRDAYEGALFYNRLVRSGAIDPEFSVAGRGTPADVLAAGSFATALVQNQQFDGQNVFNWHNNQWKPNNPDLDFYENVIFVPAALPKDSRSQAFAAQYPNDEHRTVFSARVSDEVMYRLMAVIEWASTEEGRDIVNYGLPGDAFEIRNGLAVNLIQGNALIFAHYPNGLQAFQMGQIAPGIMPAHQRAVPLWGQYYNDLFNEQNAIIEAHLRPMANLDIVNVTLPSGISFTAAPPAREADMYEIIATADSDEQFKTMWDNRIARYERSNGLALYYEWSNRTWREHFG